jgi:hypothetical protein
MSCSTRTWGDILSSYLHVYYSNKKIESLLFYLWSLGFIHDTGVSESQGFDYYQDKRLLLKQNIYLV